MGMSDARSTTRKLTSDDLVAYLDNELDSQERAALEKVLAKSADYRRRLGDFRRTWEMLDDLPRDQAGASFAETTVSMAAVATREASQVQSRERARRGRKVYWACWMIAWLTASVAAYAATYLAISKDDRDLIRHLPLIQRVDQYTQTRDLLFLQLLRDSGLFSTFDDEVIPTKPESVDVHQLTPEERRELAEKKRRFDRLSDDEQSLVADLHEQLQRDPQQAELRLVMQSYHRWLEHLGPSERLELVALTPYERVDRIRQLIERNIEGDYAQWLTRVPPQDARRIRRWLLDFVKQHQAEIVQQQPLSQRWRLAQAADFFKINRLFWLLRSPNVQVPTPTLGELQQLSLDLSSETRRLIGLATDGPQRRALVEYWVEMCTRRDRIFAVVSDGDLLEFFQRMPEPRKRSLELDQLGREELLTKLRELYIQHRTQRPKTPPRSTPTD